jgi:putative ABC transport system permease protein
MVRPIGIAGFYQIHMEINQGSEAQAVLTGQGMANLFDILGQGSAILGLVSYMTLLMGAGTVFIVAYAAGAQRTRETAVLRALGAGRWFVSGMAISESLLLAAFGCIAGLAAGHITALTIASRIRDASAIAVQPGILWETELLLFVAMLLLAAAAGLLPALQTYRQDVAASLASA